MSSIKTAHSSGAYPAWSIIIPTYNRPGEIAGCLNSLTKLTPPPGGFEVLVIDDGGAAPLEHLQKFNDQLDLRVLRQPNAGPGGARNNGLTKAQGHWVAFTDDDCRPAPDWLLLLAARLKHAPELLVGGRTCNRHEGNIYATANQIIIDLVYAFYNDNPENARFFASNNMAASRDLLVRVGGFDADGFRIASEDRDLCDRWCHAGYRMTYVEDATILHAHRLTLGAFMHQHFRYGRGAFKYHRKKRQRGSNSMRVELSFHLGLPRRVNKAFAKLPFKRWLPVLMLLTLWQVTNAAGYLAESGLQLIRR